VLALARLIIIPIYFILLNIYLIIFSACRPFHRDAVKVAGRMYCSMAKLAGLNVIVQNAEVIDPKESYVCIANHQSTYDLVTTAKFAFPGVTTIGKKSLKWIPLFGQLYWLTGNIMIDRNNSGSAQSTLKRTADIIHKTRKSVLFFPEGTRSNGRGLLPFKTGAFRIASATKNPILMICTSNNVNKIKWNRWDNGTVLVRYYEPEPFDESMDIKVMSEYYHDKMAQRLAILNQEVASYEASKKEKA
jgi:1-acyl-sn-glycerol-3-phosphate acyltransferase